MATLIGKKQADASNQVNARTQVSRTGLQHTKALTTTQVRQGMSDLRCLLETRKLYELYRTPMPRLPDMTVEQFCFSVVLATHKKRCAL